MNWRGILLENWPYKAAALLLGLLLWVNVAVEERAEEDLTVDVEWVVEDSGFVLIEAPAQVRASFQGQGSDLLNVARGSRQIRYVLDSVASGTRTIRIPPDSVHYPASANVRVTEILPPTVDLVFEPRVRALLPVRPDFDVEPAAGFQMVGQPRIEPDSVTVLGAESEVSGLTYLTTAPEALRNVRGTRRMDLRVQVPGEDPRTVELRPQIVLAAVRVDTVVERRFRVAVSDTSGVLSGGLTASPDSVTVAVRGPESVVRGLASGAVRAVIRASPPVESGQSLPLGVVLPDTSALSAAPDPPRVQVRAPGGP